MNKLQLNDNHRDDKIYDVPWVDPDKKFITGYKGWISIVDLEQIIHPDLVRKYNKELCI